MADTEMNVSEIVDDWSVDDWSLAIEVVSLAIDHISAQAERIKELEAENAKLWQIVDKAASVTGFPPPPTYLDSLRFAKEAEKEKR